jgi:hypothetical protein
MFTMDTVAKTKKTTKMMKSTDTMKGGRRTTAKAEQPGLRPRVSPIPEDQTDAWTKGISLVIPDFLTCQSSELLGTMRRRLCIEPSTSFLTWRAEGSKE